MVHSAHHDPLSITDRNQLFSLLSMHSRGKNRVIDTAEMLNATRKRLIGQDHILEPLARAIRLQWGKEHRDRPIANLLFVGPPATGKTELAKALAEHLFDKEQNMLRFEGAELMGTEAKARLIGVPEGYVGASKGGQLTRPVIGNPSRLVLFDEIEKAHASVCDLFLALMGEGRLTEVGSNERADFTQSLIILTSNAEHESLADADSMTNDPVELDRQARQILKASKTFRPEIISRIDHIFVFRRLDERSVAMVTALKIAKAAQMYGVELEFVAPEVIHRILLQSDALADTRGLVRTVDEHLGELFITARDQGIHSVRIESNDSGEVVLAEGCT